MNLGKKELTKVLKIKSGQAYAFIKELNEYEKINGCEYFKGLTEQNKKLETEIEELEKLLAIKQLEKETNRGQMLDLEKAGYCPMDEEIFNRVGGVVVGSELSHRKNCKHKGE